MRRPGSGHKQLIERQAKLLGELEALVEPTTRGDPQSPPRWTTLSVRKLEQALRQGGFTVSCGTVAHRGREWRPKGDPIEVLMHDFPDPEVPKAVPYGVYDIGENKGWVNVGMSADTAEFAVQSIRHSGGGTWKYARAVKVSKNRDGISEHQTARFPWRLELHHRTPKACGMIDYFAISRFLRDCGHRQ